MADTPEENGRPQLFDLIDEIDNMRISVGGGS
jgi:hypothetical protein